MDTEAILKQQSFYFEFQFRAAGIVDSEMTQEETEKELLEDLEKVYGPDAVKLVTLRLATEEEKASLKDHLTKKNETLN